MALLRTGRLVRLLAILAIVAVLVVAIAPAIDLDPTVLRAWWIAQLLFFILAIAAQLLIGILPVGPILAFAEFLRTEESPTAIDIRETALCLLC